MTDPIRIAVAAALAALVVGAAGGGASASHNIQRGVSLHYKRGAERFEGKVKSDPPVCLNGLVTLHKIKRGPNKVIGSDAADSGGRWSIAKRARGGRFYATVPRSQSPQGVCRAVRSPILDLG
jgi:hypothetical protein